LGRSTKYEAPHCETFSIHPLLHATIHHRKYVRPPDTRNACSREVREGKKRFNWAKTTVSELNPLKPNLVFIIFKNSVRTSKRTPHFTITKINWLMLFKEIMHVYSKNHTKPINRKY
jgi:hypothetical protein